MIMWAFIFFLKEGRLHRVLSLGAAVAYAARAERHDGVSAAPHPWAWLHPSAPPPPPHPPDSTTTLWQEHKPDLCHERSSLKACCTQSSFTALTYM